MIGCGPTGQIAFITPRMSLTRGRPLPQDTGHLLVPDPAKSMDLSGFTVRVRASPSPSSPSRRVASLPGDSASRPSCLKKLAVVLFCSAESELAFHVLRSSRILCTVFFLSAKCALPPVHFSSSFAAAFLGTSLGTDKERAGVLRSLGACSLGAPQSENPEPSASLRQRS